MEASDWPREGMNRPIAAASQSVPSPYLPAEVHRKLEMSGVIIAQLIAGWLAVGLIESDKSGTKLSSHQIFFN